MRFLKKTILWLFGIVLLIAIQGLILIYIYEKEIKTSAIENLNEQINTPIKVGKIELSYFKHFPFVSLSFPNVVIYDSRTGHQSILLSADEISLFFNVWDIYKGNYQVKKLYINKGVWTSDVDKNGISNFEIFKEDSSQTKSDSKFKLGIEEIIIKNSSVLHIDFQSNQVFRSDIQDLKAKGDFNSDNFQLDIKSALHVQAINIAKLSIVKNKRINLNTSVFVDFKNNIYKFEKTSINIEKMNLLLNGLIEYNEHSKKINLNAEGNHLDIQSFLSLLPEKYTKEVKDYRSSGNMLFKISLLGSLEKDETPQIKILTRFENTTIIINNEKIKNKELKNVNFDLTYFNNGSSTINDDEIRVNQFKANYDNSLIEGNLRVTELSNPLIDIYINTKQSLVEIQKIFPVKNITFESGNIALKLKLKARVSEFKKNNNIKQIESEGNIILTNTKIKPGKYQLSIEDLNGNYSFQKSDLRINEMHFKVGASDFEIKGFFRNLFSFVLSEDEDLQIDAILYSKKIDLKELLASSANTSEEEPYKLRINPRLSANLKLNIKELNFLPFQCFDLEGLMKIENKIINTDYLSFRSQDGLVFSKLYFNTKDKNNMPMSIDLNVNKVDVSNMFREFNNFGQGVITNKNIRGRLSSNMKLNLVWDENLETKLDAFNAKGSVLIENGQLLNFEPMLALGRFIDVNELNNLKFSNLENTIEIKDKTVFIPDMEVKSNALNLTLTGTHNFDNQIDYHLKMLLSDLIKRKSKKLGDERFGEIEPDGTGKTNLFIRMYGDASNPKFSLDKKAIRKKISEDLKQEKVEVKQILKDEFGSWFKKEKEFKETITDESADWEKDLPQQKSSNKSVSSKIDSTTKKSNLQKLKEKLKEKPTIEDE